MQLQLRVMALLVQVGFKASFTDSLGSLKLSLSLFDLHKITPLMAPHVCCDDKCLWMEDLGDHFHLCRRFCFHENYMREYRRHTRSACWDRRVKWNVEHCPPLGRTTQLTH